MDREIESRGCVLFILIPVHFQPTEVGNEKEVKEVHVCTTSYAIVVHIHCIRICIHMYICVYNYSVII